MSEVSGLEEFRFSGNKQANLFAGHLKKVTGTDPLEIYVGSCPDYSHRDGLYTHETLGNGIPLLSQIHLETDVKLLNILKKHKVPFKYTIMIADVEAMDEIFCERFTGGIRAEFLSRCLESKMNTSELLERIAAENDIDKSQVNSSSFFDEFGKEEFANAQEFYEGVLHFRYTGTDSSFRSRVASDILARMNMYEKMYKPFMKDLARDEKNSFFVTRTIRTMAQYLTLGKLITEKSKYPTIINHPTRNIGLFNDRNKFLYPGDIESQQKSIPVIEMKRKVY